MSRAAQCPCGSDRVYAVCCKPFHDGVSEAPDAEALMRSRYSAFAMKRPEYLWKTLHPDHPDRAASEPDGLARLRHAAESHRYMGLAILDRAAPDGGIAKVLFHAKVFQKGRDVSFVECSDFAHDGDGWRYLAGVGVLASGLRDGLAGITIARFLELHEA
ncbi:MAG: YchJ family metal-binding protein [Polyangiales bacterium]